MAVVETPFAWRIEQGEREVLEFPVVDDDNPDFDITGWTVTATIRTHPGGELLYTFPESAFTVLSDNVIQVLIPGPVSASWSFTQGWYRVKVTDPEASPSDPSTYRVLAGPLVIDPDLAQASAGDELETIPPPATATQIHAVGNSGTTLALDAASTAGRIKTITLNANCTITLTGATAGRAATLELVLTQDATGNRRITWPTSVRWPGGGPPDLSTHPGSVDRIVLTSYNGGTTWLGELTETRFSRTGSPLIGWSMPAGPPAKLIAGVENEVLGRWQACGTWPELAGGLYLADTYEYPGFVLEHPGRAVDLGMGLIPHQGIAEGLWDAELDEVAAGDHDADHFAQGQALADLGTATVYVRPWWEFNLVSPSPMAADKFRAAWRRAIPKMRQGFALNARPGQKLEVVFCYLAGRTNQYDFYPGDDVVDIIGSDIYGFVYLQAPPSIPQMIAQVTTLLNELSTFGRAHGKRVAVNEWANCSPKALNGEYDIRGCGDCVEYIDLMFDWAIANHVLYLCFYNSGEAGVGVDLDDTPNSKARFIQRAQAIQTIPAAAVPDAPTIGTTTASYNAVITTFTPALTGAPAVSYTATAAPGGLTGTGSASPITVPGLTVGTSYTVTVRATNTAGNSGLSAASNSASPLVPVVYASDNFNRTDGAVGSTPVGGFAWAVASGLAGGTWTINGNQLQGVGGGQHVFVANTGQADGSVSITRAGGTDDGLAFRVVDQNNWWALWPSPYDGHYHLLKRFGGDYFDLASSDIVVAGGDRLTAVLNGNSIVCKVNGTVAFSRTDPHLATATRHGVRTVGSGTVSFNDFYHDSVNI